VSAATVLAGPYKDPATGRWLPGNSASRLRALKRAPKLTTLNPAACAPWARPFVELAQREASELAAEVAADGSASLLGFAEDAATAVAMHRAFLAIAMSPDTDPSTRDSALNEARMWMKERRQELLSLRAEARAGLPRRRPDDGEPWAEDVAAERMAAKGAT
jgi:hypothetical protein